MTNLELPGGEISASMWGSAISSTIPHATVSAGSGKRGKHMTAIPAAQTPTNTAPRRATIGPAAMLAPRSLDQQGCSRHRTRNTGCNLSPTHDELEAGSGMAKGIKQGWPAVLSSLKSFLETGRGIDLFAKSKSA